MNTLDSRLIKINESSHQPPTDYKALTKALQQDISDAVRNIEYAYKSLLEWHNRGLHVPKLAIWDLEQALHKLDASHLITTDFGDPLPVVTDDSQEGA